jgi:hypothetical protein
MGKNVKNVDVGYVKKMEQGKACKGINVINVDMYGRIKDRKKIITNFMTNTQYENRHMPN